MQRGQNLGHGLAVMPRREARLTGEMSIKASLGASVYERLFLGHTSPEVPMHHIFLRQQQHVGIKMP
jgi:hypothetical protein